MRRIVAATCIGVGVGGAYWLRRILRVPIRFTGPFTDCGFMPVQADRDTCIKPEEVPSSTLSN